MVEWAPPDFNLIEKWQEVLEQNIQDKNTYLQLRKKIWNTIFKKIDKKIIKNCLKKNNCYNIKINKRNT